MKIALVTDAWTPQVNGVVRTWTEVIRQMEGWGHQTLVVHPGLFRTVAVPNYPEIRLAMFAREKVASMLDNFQPDAIHVATEGPLGFACRTYCVKRDLQFTTSYHTQYAQYLKMYYRMPAKITWTGMRWFHRAAVRTLVPTRSVARELESEGFRNTVVWSRGVDLEVFKPWGKEALRLPRPIFLFAGRIAREKISRRSCPWSFPAAK